MIYREIIILYLFYIPFIYAMLIIISHTHIYIYIYIFYKIENFD